MNDEDFKDACAMLAMLGWIINGDYALEVIPHMAWRTANRMVETRNEPEDGTDEGIVAIKKRKYTRKGEA
jgi:hypothetical protein